MGTDARQLRPRAPRYFWVRAHARGEQSIMAAAWWKEVVDAFDPDTVGTEAATRNRFLAAVGP